MNFTSSKEFGKMAREIAEHFNNSDYIKAASTLSYSIEKYFTTSRVALTEIYLSKTHHLKTVKMIVDEYIINDDVIKFCNNRELFDPARDEDIYIEFVKNDVGLVFQLLHNLRLDIVALETIAHPEDYSKEMVTFFMNEIIIERINDSEPNIRMWNYCCDRLKNQTGNKNEKGEQKTEDAKILKNDILNRDESKHNKEKNDVFEIINLNLLIEIHKFIIATEVISKDYSFLQFAIAVEQANINSIPIEKEKKLISILKPLKDFCIGRNKREWYRRACASINVEPTRVTSNNTNLKEWYEDLEKIVSKYTK